MGGSEAFAVDRERQLLPAIAVDPADSGGSCSTDRGRIFQIKGMTMLKVSIVFNVALSIAALAMGWVIYTQRSAPAVVPSASERSSAPSIISADDNAAVNTMIVGQLRAIDARLQAIERGSPAKPAADDAERSRPPAINPQAAAAADRRIKEMFPDSKFDHTDTIRFQSTLASLPREERDALALAFSRAVNSDRLKMRR
jgi:hypothetical protein